MRPERISNKYFQSDWDLIKWILFAPDYSGDPKILNTVNDCWKTATNLAKKNNICKRQQSPLTKNQTYARIWLTWSSTVAVADDFL